MWGYFTLQLAVSRRVWARGPRHRLKSIYTDEDFQQSRSKCLSMDVNLERKLRSVDSSTAGGTGALQRARRARS